MGGMISIKRGLKINFLTKGTQQLNNTLFDPNIKWVRVDAWSLRDLLLLSN
jgi:hypothetical protein